LKTRSKREKIGAGIEFCDAFRRYSTEHRDTVAELSVRNISVQLVSSFGIAAAIASDCKVPWQVGERRERGDKHVKPLARHHRANREQTYDTIVASVCRRDRIGSGICHHDVTSRHSVISRKEPRGRNTRHNDASCSRQRRALASTEVIGLRRGQPRFQRERMMHKRYYRMMGAKL